MRKFTALDVWKTADVSSIPIGKKCVIVYDIENRNLARYITNSDTHIETTFHIAELISIADYYTDVAQLRYVCLEDAEQLYMKEFLEKNIWEILSKISVINAIEFVLDSDVVLVETNASDGILSMFEDNSLLSQNDCLTLLTQLYSQINRENIITYETGWRCAILHDAYANETLWIIQR